MPTVSRSSARCTAAYGSKSGPGQVGLYIIIGPHWKGKVPAGITAVFRASKNTVFVIPRVFQEDTPDEKDGSLTLYLQASSPGPEKEANWLPTPAGESFSVYLCDYWPGDDAVQGKWTPPAVVRVQ